MGKKVINHLCIISSDLNTIFRFVTRVIHHNFIKKALFIIPTNGRNSMKETLIEIKIVWFQESNSVGLYITTTETHLHVERWYHWDCYENRDKDRKHRLSYPNYK